MTDQELNNDYGNKRFTPAVMLVRVERYPQGLMQSAVVVGE